MKRALAVLLCACLLLSLAACGTGAADPAEANRLVIWHDKEDAVIEALESYLAEAVPELEIIFEKKTSLTDSLKLVGNDPSAAPDMFIFAHDKVGVFAEMGILAPIEPLLETGALENYLPMTLEAASYQDTLYQLPLYFETLLFMYNRRYMQDDEVPATTGALLTYMENNTGRGRYGFVEQHSTAYYSAAWIHGFGGAIIDESGTPFPDAQAVKDALAYGDHIQIHRRNCGISGILHPELFPAGIQIPYRHDPRRMPQSAKLKTTRYQSGIGPFP